MVSSEVFEDVWFEGHVDVEGPEDVTELTVLDLEESFDVFWGCSDTWFIV